MILLDASDIKVSCLNVCDNQLPAEMIAELRHHVLPVYIDRDTGLEEDMFSFDDIMDEFGEDNLTKWNDVLDELRMLVEKYECGYFRIIKTRGNVQQAEGTNSTSAERHEKDLARV